MIFQKLKYSNSIDFDEFEADFQGNLHTIHFNQCSLTYYVKEIE